jgi:hypothetical protein
MIHDVPYYSQWESSDLVGEIVTGRMNAADDPLWHRSGAVDPAEYSWWAGRLCGVACLRMAIHHWHGITPPPAIRLARELVKAGAYVHRDDGGLGGLYYAPFARYVGDTWGLPAQSRPVLPASEIPDHITAGRLVMLSVHRTIRTLDPAPPQQGGHLVLAVGITDDAVLIHNPSGLPARSQRHAAVPWADLDRFYANRGVVLSTQ